MLRGPVRARTVRPRFCGPDARVLGLAAVLLGGCVEELVVEGPDADQRVVQLDHEVVDLERPAGYGLPSTLWHCAQKPLISVARPRMRSRPQLSLSTAINMAGNLGSRRRWHPLVGMLPADDDGGGPHAEMLERPVKPAALLGQERPWSQCIFPACRGVRQDERGPHPPARKAAPNCT